MDAAVQPALPEPRYAALELEFDRIFINIAGICFFCHLMACAWYFQTQFDDDNMNWAVKLKMNDEAVIDRYLISLYWIAQTV